MLWLWVLGLSLLAAAALAFATYTRVMAPVRAIHRGAYREARELLAEPWWLDRMASVRAAKQYNVALAWMLSGNMGESRAALATLPEELDANLTYARESLTAAVLALSGEDPTQTLAHVRAARGHRDTPGTAWLEAALCRQVGEEAAALTAAGRAAELAQPSLVLGAKTVLIHAAELERADSHYWQGRFLELGGDAEAARKAYEVAATTSLPSVYRTSAREALSDAPIRSAAEPEAPSTLAPHVISRR